MSPSFTFEPLREPVPWAGRYNRIPGNEPAFHASSDGSAHAYWSPWKSGEWLTSAFVDSPSIRQMVKAINHAKERHAGKSGGAFQINEFGQIICPISSSVRYLVGNAIGIPTFKDPRAGGKAFELLLPPSTKVGTPWNRPYIGMKFNIDAHESIYFRQDDGDTTSKIRLIKSDPELVRRLRHVRGVGKTVRFIVNLHGAVLTKTEPDWQPLFVGHISLSRWFSKEA